MSFVIKMTKEPLLSLVLIGFYFQQATHSFYMVKYASEIQGASFLPFHQNVYLRKFPSSRCSTSSSSNDDDNGSPVAAVTNSHFYSKKKFCDLGVSSTMESVLNHLQLEGPSKIQALSYNQILSGKSCVLADQTGQSMLIPEASKAIATPLF